MTNFKTRTIDVSKVSARLFMDIVQGEMGRNVVSDEIRDYMRGLKRELKKQDNPYLNIKGESLTIAQFVPNKKLDLKELLSEVKQLLEKGIVITQIGDLVFTPFIWGFDPDLDREHAKDSIKCFLVNGENIALNLPKIATDLLLRKEQVEKFLNWNPHVGGEELSYGNLSKDSYTIHLIQGEDLDEETLEKCRIVLKEKFFQTALSMHWCRQGIEVIKNKLLEIDNALN